MKVLSKFIVFCIVGGFSFVIDIGFVNLFFLLGLSFPTARTFSIALALIFNFFANRNLTFKATGREIKRQVVPYIIVYLFANLINLFSSILVVKFAGENLININIASLIGTALSIPFSFFGSMIWAFKKK